MRRDGIPNAPLANDQEFLRRVTLDLTGRIPSPADVREFLADKGGAEISGDPEALASALEKIHRYAQGLPLDAAERHPETAQMMIMNPLSGGGLKGLFSTHPDTGERVARLRAMARA